MILRELVRSKSFKTSLTNSTVISDSCNDAWTAKRLSAHLLPKTKGRRIDGHRFYEIDGKNYPSITTVLNIRKKDGLAEWRKNVGEGAANWEMARAARRGKATHTLIEQYLKSETPSERHSPGWRLRGDPRRRSRARALGGNRAPPTADRSPVWHRCRPTRCPPASAGPSGSTTRPDARADPAPPGA